MMIFIALATTACVGRQDTTETTDISQQNAQIELNTWQKSLLKRNTQTASPRRSSQKGFLLGTNKKSHVFSGQAPLAKAATYSDDILTGTVHLNYIDVDIKQATRSILNDILKKGFVIDQSLSGNVNLKTQGPVSKRKALNLLEDVLTQHDAHIVQESGVYKVARKGRHRLEAITTGSVKSSKLSGTHVVRLKHISSTEMAEILKPYAEDAIINVDVERNALVLSGSGSEFRSWMKTIRTFDVDWLADRSVGVFKIDSMAASKMVESLEKLMKSENTDTSSARFAIIETNNSVLAIAKTPEILSSIKLWVQRLESANGGSVRLYAYDMKYAQASSVAPILADLFNISISSHDGNKSENPISAEAGGETREQAAQVEFGANNGSGSQNSQSGTRIVANDASNSLLIYANKDTYNRMLSALRTIDIPEKQVLVEAVIVEVTLNESLRHGVQYALDKEIKGITLKGNLTNSETGLDIAPQAPGFSVSIESPVQVIIDALDNITSVNVISSPNMMVLNNRTARLSVGDQVPVATQTQTDPLTNNNVLVNSIEFRDTGVIFDVTPRISSADSVLLNITQEISSVGPTNSTLTPTISQRKFSSSISVDNGKTVVLGGLFAETKSRSNVGIPGLNRLPKIGKLFGRSNNRNLKTELLVLISPKIIKNASDAHQVTRELSSRIQQLKEIDTASIKK